MKECRFYLIFTLKI